MRAIAWRLREMVQLTALSSMVLLSCVALQYFLQPKMDLEKLIHQADLLKRVLPAGSVDVTNPEDLILIDDTELLELRQPKPMLLVRKHGQLFAVVIPVTARDGYAGDIDLSVAVYADGSVAGVTIISHHETQGLGDRIERTKTAWLDGFLGKSLNNLLPEQWQLKRDGGQFDQLTGATLTSSATTQAIHRALEYFNLKRSLLFSHTAIAREFLHGA